MSARVKDVAEKAQVSTATVSHVINNSRYVSEEIKQRVMQAIKELDYRPNSVARSLRSNKSNIIGLLFPVSVSDTSNFFFAEVAQGIQMVLKKQGYNLILSNSNERLEDEKEQIKVLNSQQIDGLIIAPTFSDHAYLNEVLKGNYPVVFIDRRPINYSGDCVLADGFKGTYEAVDMLIKKGHKKIGFITGELGITTSDERLSGYKRALIDNGVSIDMTLIKEGQASFDNGYVFAEQLVEENKISAIFVANNVMTIGAFKCLKDKKISIPQQVSVIGFDDYEWTRITDPPLTVVKQPSIELGEKAAEILLKRINEQGKDFREYLLPTHLTVRESC